MQESNEKGVGETRFPAAEILKPRDFKSAQARVSFPHPLQKINDVKDKQNIVNIVHRDTYLQKIYTVTITQ